MNIKIENFEIKIIRKKIKNLHLYVKAPDGRVELTVPYGVSEKFIRDFIASKSEWIKAKQAQVVAASENIKEYTKEEAKEKREYLCGKINEILPKLEALTGLHPELWQIRNMKTRWGTCNAKTKKIWLNLQLAEKPDICIEYVILHELIHLKIPNHGKEFKENLDKYMPQWREIKKILNSNQ